MPFFSIIIPSFNRAGYLPKVLGQIAAQGINDVEVILVDDGSSDDTAAVLEQWRQVHELDVHYVYQENQGVTAARNAGAQLATGEYLIFLDTDDDISATWLKDFQETLARQPEADVAFCSIQVQSAKHYKTIHALAKSDETQLLPLFKAGAFAIRTSFFNSIGAYDAQVKFGENTELGMRVQLHNGKLAFIDKLNFFYTPSTHGGSKNLQNMVKGNSLVMKKHPDFFLKHKQFYQSYLQTTAVAHYKLGDRRYAKHFFKKAWQLRPLNHITTARWVISHLPPIASKIWKPLSQPGKIT